MIEQAKDILEEIDKGGVIEKVAKLYKKLFKALVKEGFTEEQAIAIVAGQGL